MNLKDSEKRPAPEQKPKRYLYKGLDVEAFPMYFAQNGISPHLGRSWITNSSERAHVMALWRAVTSRQTGSLSRPYALAAINYDVIERENLRHDDDKIETIFGTYYDFYGYGLVRWDDIAKLIVNQSANAALTQMATNHEFQHWDQLEPKLIVLPPETRLLHDNCDFIDQMLGIERKRLF